MDNQILQVSQSESSDSEFPPAIGKEISLPTDLSLINFIEENYYGTTIKQWYDWKWQIINSITDTEKLIKLLGKKKNGTIINMPKNHLPFRITPHFVHLLDSLPSDHPLYKTIIPTINELNSCDGEKEDPLDEQKNSPVPNIVHRYPDRALFLVTNFCSTYCRYCTRSHMVSKENNINATKAEWEKGFEYIENNPIIRDVIVSGGDPLTLRDDQIEYILSRLRSIKHVEIIRLGTKVPVVLPMRITSELTNILKRYHPLYMSIHFTHPDELTEETQKACNMLADAGVQMLSQTVLLKDINDNIDVMKKLMHKLLVMRVKPYYLYQMDRIPGGEHFRAPISTGLNIINGLAGYTSGLAVPKYIVDSVLGKIDISSAYNILDFNGKIYNLKSFNGEILNYPEKEYSYPL